jgi:hypothetical protein
VTCESENRVTGQAYVCFTEVGLRLLLTLNGRPTQAQAAAGDDQPAVVRVGAKVVRGVTGAAKAIAGAVRWLVDLWRQADRNTDPTDSQAMAASPGSPASSFLSPRRCL